MCGKAAVSVSIVKAGKAVERIDTAQLPQCTRSDTASQRDGSSYQLCLDASASLVWYKERTSKAEPSSTVEGDDSSERASAELKAMATTDASGKNARIRDEQGCVKSLKSASLRKQVGGPVELTTA
jgi:hypothetical protein